MKHFPLLLLPLFCLFCLSACGDTTETSTSDEIDSTLGKYQCISILMDGASMNPTGKWLQLNADGTADTFLSEEESEAEWRLSGQNFTMTVAGQTVGTGELQGTTLTLKMMGMVYTFVQEGATGQQDADSSSAAYATFTCYGNLYAVRYPTALFQQDPAGLSDLYSDDGTKGWITKLNAPERVTEWLTGFDEKAQRPGVEDYQSLEFTVAGYPARAIVYRDEQGWHSEVVVNFGKDLGNETYPMYAAYIYFTGETYMSVWSEDVQGIINSLTLTN